MVNSQDSFFKTLQDIQTVITRDGKDATYKFALLRGAIEIVQEFEHLKESVGKNISYPFGLLLEKWVLYYYPLLESERFIPQKNGETEAVEKGKSIAFRKEFLRLIDGYREMGGFQAFYFDYQRGRIPSERRKDFFDLLKKLRSTISRMPMKHLGFSVNKVHYSVFSPVDPLLPIRYTKEPALDRAFLINNFGRFQILQEYYQVFRSIGSLISGTHSILMEWAAFSTRADQTGGLSKEWVLSKLGVFPDERRQVREVTSFYQSMQLHSSLSCVWSGKKLSPGINMHIDHVIPFSLWGNNDLWNLLPAHEIVNKKKSDKVPSYDRLQWAKEEILFYWQSLSEHFGERFFKEVNVSLIGFDIPPEDNWKEVAFNNLNWKCKYLIEWRGCESF